MHAMEDDVAVRVAIAADDVHQFDCSGEIHWIKAEVGMRGHRGAWDEELHHVRIEDEVFGVGGGFPRGVDDGFLTLGGGGQGEGRDFGVGAACAGEPARVGIDQEDETEDAFRDAKGPDKHVVLVRPTDVVTEVGILASDVASGFAIGDDVQERGAVIAQETFSTSAITHQVDAQTLQKVEGQRLGGAGGGIGGGARSGGGRSGAAIDHDLGLAEAEILMPISDFPLNTAVVAKDGEGVGQLPLQLKIRHRIDVTDIWAFKDATGEVEGAVGGGDGDASGGWETGATFFAIRDGVDGGPGGFSLDRGGALVDELVDDDAHLRHPLATSDEIHPEGAGENATLHDGHEAACFGSEEGISGGARHNYFRDNGLAT